ncbi:MAG: site-specific integrase [Gammaproteobacteria bacterium]|nr:site-specific integrase [Gammaproteobacteria bacterium]
MPTTSVALSGAAIDALTPGKTRREISFVDDRGDRINGLRLFLTPAGARTFYYTFRVAGQNRRVRIEEYRSHHFDTAQKPEIMRAVVQFQRDRDQGKTPASEYREKQKAARQQAKAEREASHRPTLRTVADKYIKAISTPGAASRHVKTWKESDRMLKKDILPALGLRIAADLTRSDFRSAFKVVAKRGVAVAANTQAVTVAMLNWAVDEELIPFNPVAGMKKVAGTKPARDRDLSEDEIKTFWHGLDALYTPTYKLHGKERTGSPTRAVSEEIAIALRLLLLTGCRRSEVALATWKEINRKQKLWEIPKHRTKTGAAMVVPLTDEMLALLDQLKKMTGTTPYWFPQKESTSETEYVYHAAPIHPATISKALLAARRRGAFGDCAPYSVHDLRRTFRTRIVTLGVDRDTAERLLNHRVGSAVERTYDRYSYLDEKRAALTKWTRYVLELVGQGGEVVEIKA